MRKSTIKLTKTEFEFAGNEQYPLLKQAVIQKLSQRFDQLGATLRDELQVSHLQGRFDSFKTTRGENYQGLPFVVVDFPKIGSKDFDLLCRTMFWWGRYFSLNVFVRTEAFDISRLVDSLSDPIHADTKVYTGPDMWQQNLDDRHFVAAGSVAGARLQNGMPQPYLKLSRNVLFSDEDDLETRATQFYGAVLGCLQP